tara:strand:- start:1497 stop:1808 length:312 start_codon:yes stop_codon:yes gene_type:complete
MTRLLLLTAIFLGGCSDPQLETRDLYNICFYQALIDQDICINEKAKLKPPNQAVMQCIIDSLADGQQCSQIYWDQGDHVHELSQDSKNSMRSIYDLPPEPNVD